MSRLIHLTQTMVTVALSAGVGCVSADPVGEALAPAEAPLARGGRVLPVGEVASPLTEAAWSSAPSASQPEGVAAGSAGLVAVSDWGYTRVRLINAETYAVVYDLDIGTYGADACTESGVGCYPLGFQYTNQGGSDFLDVSVNVSHPSGNYASLGRFRPTTPPTRVFTLDSLDFSDIPSEQSFCEQPEGESCASPEERSCRLIDVHAFNVIDDNPEEGRVTLVTTDPSNSRVMQITLDYSDPDNRCGHVDWVLGSGHPDWAGGFPNAVQYLDEGLDGIYVLVTFLDTPSDKGIMCGRLQMWKQVGDGWELMWSHPRQTDKQDRCLYAPHMGNVLTDPRTGERWLWYNHTMGMTEGVGFQGCCGSYGLLDLGRRLSDPPRYMFDAVFEEGGPLIYASRDTDYRADGTLQFMDTGAFYGNPERAAVHHVAPFFDDATPSGKSGHFTFDQRHMELRYIPLESLLDTYQCYSGPFEAKWIPGEALGNTFSKSGAEAAALCEMQ